jgi:hypothetical protein
MALPDNCSIRHVIPGRQPMAALEQFHIYCLQNWFSLSGRQMEDALY